MSKSTTLYVGLDVHKESIDIGVCDAPRAAPVHHLGTVGGGCEPVTKALRRQVSAGRRLHLVYEAGPCGFKLARHFAALGWHCDVAAPSLIPSPPGERIKTDRRDAVKLARLVRAGELTAVRVPDSADEAVRDVVRAREDAVREQRNARHRLKALLLRNRIAYTGRSSWTAAHLRWLASVKMPSRRSSWPFRSTSTRSANPLRASSAWSRHFASSCRNGPWRHWLLEAAHAYRFPARVSPVIARRIGELPKPVTDIAWQAQTRLCARFRRLAARKLTTNKIVVAIARELAGFAWAVAREVTPLPQSRH